jgi:hypothetical protein
MNPARIFAQHQYQCFLINFKRHHPTSKRTRMCVRATNGSDEGLRRFHAKDRLGKAPIHVRHVYFQPATQNERSRTDQRWRRRTTTRKVLEASLRRDSHRKAPKHASCYYYTEKCYFDLVPQKGILWVGRISPTQW